MDSVDQDQTAFKMESDLLPTLSDMVIFFFPKITFKIATLWLYNRLEGSMFLINQV